MSMMPLCLFKAAHQLLLFLWFPL